MIDQQLLLAGRADDLRAAVALQLVHQPGADRVHPLDLAEIDGDVARPAVSFSCSESLRTRSKVRFPLNRRTQAPSSTFWLKSAVTLIVATDMLQILPSGKELGWTASADSMLAGAPMKATLAIYDMDRTVTRGPTFGPFLWHAMWRLAPWRVLLAPLGPARDARLCAEAVRPRPAEGDQLPPARRPGGAGAAGAGGAELRRQAARHQHPARRPHPDRRGQGGGAAAGARHRLLPALRRRDRPAARLRRRHRDRHAGRREGPHHRQDRRRAIATGSASST